MNNWQQHQYLSLATQKRDGSWVETPVWFAKQGDTFYCFSESKAGKVKRINNFNSVKITPCSLTGKLLGEKQSAIAEILSSPSDITQAHKALVQSYSWKMKALDCVSRLAGKINKRAFIRVKVTN